MGDIIYILVYKVTNIGYYSRSHSILPSIFHRQTGRKILYRDFILIANGVCYLEVILNYTKLTTITSRVSYTISVM